MKVAPALPPLKRCATPQEIVDEHLDALNQGDWDRAMAQYPEDVEIFLPDGVLVKGREKVGELFWGFFQPRGEGGFGGIHFDVVHSSPVGDTINVIWRITADYLAEPYVGTDSYCTQDGLMRAQVSTLRPQDMKFK